MKKALLIIFLVPLVLLAVAATLPFIFKDKIQQAVEAELKKSLAATIKLDPTKVGLSIFSHFPDITVSVDDFGVYGKGDFDGLALIEAKNFAVSLDVMSVINGDKIKINHISLADANINARILPNGKANWDIAIPDTTAKEEKPTEPSKFSIGIKSWEISNSNVTYYDYTMQLFSKIKGLNHTGTGDFTQDIFDLNTKTSADSVTVDFDSVNYFTNKKFDIEMALNMDLPKSKFTFKDNQVKINEFAFGFDGWLIMLNEGFDMDIKWAAKQTDFKTFLSIIPGAYTEGFNDIKAEGELAFGGYVKGKFTDNLMPAFGLDLKVNNAMVQYPKLPQAVTDINIDLSVKNVTPQLVNTEIDLKSFAMRIGTNPISAKANVKGLEAMQIAADVKAKLNLAEITKAVPVEGMQLSGFFTADAKINGLYDAANKKMPDVAAKLTLLEGFVKSKDFPLPLEKINLNADVSSAGGDMAKTAVRLNQFAMVLDGEPLSMQASFNDFTNLKYDVQMKGIIDLAKMTKVYPIADMALAGRINADISTKGTMADVDAKNYKALPTNGTMSVENFSFSSKDVPQGVKITKAAMTFSPQSANLSELSGFLGKSDVAMKGSLTNYLGYVLSDEALKGNLTMTSSKFDVNEWMPAEETPTTTTTAEPTGVMQLPKNIDFVFAAAFTEMLYADQTFTNAKGTITLKNGVLNADNMGFNAMGGSIVMDAMYDPTLPAEPKFAFDMDIKEVAIKEMVKTFSTIEKMVPVAKNMDGSFSTKFKMEGPLKQDMSPDLGKISGSGLLGLAETKVSNLSLINGVNSYTKLGLKNEVLLAKGTKILAEILNGRINFQPFDMVVGGNKMNLGGSQGLDGSLDYMMKTVVPAGAVGGAINSAIGKLTGVNSLTGNQNLKLNIKVGGTSDKPTFSLVSVTGESVKDQAKTAITNKVNDLKAEAEAKAKAEADRLRQEAETKARAEADRLKKEAEDKAKAEAEKLKNQAKDKAKEELNKLKGKIKF